VRPAADTAWAAFAGSQPGATPASTELASALEPPSTPHMGSARQSAEQPQVGVGKPRPPQVQVDGMHSDAVFRQVRAAGLGPEQLAASVRRGPASTSQPRAVQASIGLVPPLPLEPPVLDGPAVDMLPPAPPPEKVPPPSPPVGQFPASSWLPPRDTELHDGSTSDDSASSRNEALIMREPPERNDRSSVRLEPSGP
jgi:hypothetical protein